MHQHDIRLMQENHFIETVRGFNRYYTLQLGLLNRYIFDSDYSLSQVRILYELAHSNASTSTQLYSLLQMDAGYVSRILKGFEKDGLITREKSAGDARSRLIRLTDKGKKLLEQLNGRSNLHIDALTRQLGVAEKQTLLDGMQAIRKLLSGGNNAAKQPDAALTIRTELKPSDMGYIIYLHGLLYKQEYNYGLEFEAYVAAGVYEFYRQYNPATSRIWLAEHHGEIAGCLALMNRGKAAQLRYFLIRPEYRGKGLGKRMMDLLMDFVRECRYESCYLLTTPEQQGAARLYRSYGFVLTEEKEDDIFDKPLKVQRYDLLLTQ